MEYFLIFTLITAGLLMMHASRYIKDEHYKTEQNLWIIGIVIVTSALGYLMAVWLSQNS